MIFLCFLLGFLPILWWYLPMNSQFNVLLLGTLFLIVWMVIGFFVKRQKISMKSAQICTHLPATLALVHILSTLIIRSGIFSGQIALWLRRVLEPTLKLVQEVFGLLHINLSSFIGVIIAYGLMHLFFYIGQRIR